ncbi:MFS transporter [Xylophilus sp. ASV27]|uniref:MFS transporter n=1 Tax=Xylophilus sp. ASV27 TaxID=2795129 RepID=UPI0018EAF6EA|nr:MFS transporter [Xylophilus sp. ASV27]
MTTPLSLPPGRERALLWLLALTQFTIIMDFMVMMPLGPQIMQAFSVGPSAFATAVSTYSWCAGISGFFAATYVDRFDRKRLLLAVYALFALSNLGCALADSYSTMLLSRAFAGLTGGVLGSMVLSIVGDAIAAERRGAAMGLVMTSFSLAAIAGVPLGVVLGAHFGWSTPFFVLVLFSVLIWLGAQRVMPPMTAHIVHPPVPASQILPQLFALMRQPEHVRAFGLTALVMVAHMMLVPFIAPVLVANHGVQPEQISWIYLSGGAATLFTSRAIGRLADRYGKQRMFRIVALASLLPMMFITHLPMLPLLAIVLLFPCFMVTANGRMIPMQALLTMVPDPSRRGAFMSVNSAVQQVATGTGAWLGGLLLANGADGSIQGFGTNGWVASVLVLLAVCWVGQVRAAAPGAARSAVAS